MPEAGDLNEASETPEASEMPEVPALSAEDVAALMGQSKTYEELADENEQLKDRLLRALSEAENTRRRGAREVKDAAKYGISNFARDLVEVADNLRRALAAVPQDLRENASSEVQTLITGIEMTDKELHSAFERHAIRVLHPTDEKFDPNFHQAIAEIPGTDKPHGTVVDVVQTGYIIEDRLLRPAMVTVARGSHPAKQVTPEAAVPDEDEE